MDKIRSKDKGETDNEKEKREARKKERNNERLKIDEENTERKK
jgi:hypothetical protein